MSNSCLGYLTRSGALYDHKSTMAEDQETYIAVLKAVYDYDPQPDAEDEIALKEDQILLLVERVDDE